MSKHKVGNLVVDVALDALDVQTIRIKTPVKTGQLRDGFKLDTEGNIMNEVEYADEVEFGTLKRPGSFMVERSLPEISERLAKRVAQQIDRPGLIVLPEITMKIKV